MIRSLSFSPFTSINRVAIFLAACLSFVVPPTMLGQSRTLVGLDLRLHDVRHSGGFRTLVDTGQFLFQDGTGFGQSFGLKLERRLSRSFGISTTLSYNNLPGTFTTSIENARGGDYELEFIGGGPIDTLEFRDDFDRLFVVAADVYYKTLSVEALVQWRPYVPDSTWSIGIAAGPTLDYMMQGEMIETLTIVEPQNMRLANPNNRLLEDNGRRAVIYENEIPTARKVRLGWRAGVVAEFGNLNSGIILSPGIFYQGGLTDVTRAEPWSLSTLTGQVSVMIGL